jgi:hypothetical protein
MIDREAIIKEACRDTLRTNFEDNSWKSSYVSSSAGLKSYTPKDKPGTPGVDALYLQSFQRPDEHPTRRKRENHGRKNKKKSSPPYAKPA